MRLSSAIRVYGDIALRSIAGRHPLGGLVPRRPLVDGYQFAFYNIDILFDLKDEDSQSARY
jgi:hypothetical protein